MGFIAPVAAAVGKVVTGVFSATKVAGAISSIGVGAKAASALGTVISSAATGAAVNAGIAAVTGQKIGPALGRGALFGAGIGALGAVGGLVGGASPLLGGAATSGASGAINLPSGPVPALATGQGLLPSASQIATAAGMAAPMGAALPGATGGVLSSVLTGVTDPSALARLTMLAMMGGNQGLTGEEKRLVDLRRQELQEMASRDRAMYERQISEANRLFQMRDQAAAQPEQAFAQTQLAAQRQLSEATRGLAPSQQMSEARRTAIRSAVPAAFAVSQDAMRANNEQRLLQVAGNQALAGIQQPERAAGLMMPLANAIGNVRRNASAQRLAMLPVIFPSLYNNQPLLGARAG
ncbi:MAG: hypothetical protein QW318_07960 [Candidatus Caldarchaeum sp.]